MSRGALSVISEDDPKGQDPVSGDVSQCHQPQELSGATGVAHAESEEEPPHQMDDLNASLDDLSVTSLPEASAIRPNQDYNLVNSLLNLTRSPVSQLLTFPHDCNNTYLKQRHIYSSFNEKTLNPFMLNSKVMCVFFLRTAG